MSLTCGFSHDTRDCYRSTVIRNVVLVKLKPGRDPAEIADIQEDFRRLTAATLVP
jgi:hypothetical protein